MGNLASGLLGGLAFGKKDRESRVKWKERASSLQDDLNKNKLKRRSLLDSDLIGDDVFAQNKINTFLDRD